MKSAVKLFPNCLQPLWGHYNHLDKEAMKGVRDELPCFDSVVLGSRVST